MMISDKKSKIIYALFVKVVIKKAFFFLAVIDAVVINAPCIIMKYIINVPDVNKMLKGLYQKFSVFDKKITKLFLNL